MRVYGSNYNNYKTIPRVRNWPPARTKSFSLSAPQVPTTIGSRPLFATNGKNMRGSPYAFDCSPRTTHEQTCPRACDAQNAFECVCAGWLRASHNARTYVHRTSHALVRVCSSMWRMPRTTLYLDLRFLFRIFSHFSEFILCDRSLTSTTVE